jgi:competence protein ComEA
MKQCASVSAAQSDYSDTRPLQGPTRWRRTHRLWQTNTRGKLFPHAAAAAIIGEETMFKKTLCALALSLAMALPAFAATPVNINTADAQTIATSLDGVGISKAEAIVAYRKAHGAFKNVDEVGNVKGIGTKTLARNREAIHLSGSFAPAAAKPKHAKHPRKH